MSREDGRRVTKMATADVGFYNAQEGTKGRDGGPYLDDVQRQAAEVQRAKAEGRDPVLDGPLTSTAGTLLVVKENVVDNSGTSNPSMATEPVAADSPVITVPVDQTPDDGNPPADAPPAEPAPVTP